MDFVPLCEPWPVEWCCQLDLTSAPVTGMAVQAASEYVWAVSGRQFGSCEVLIRPCRRECGPDATDWWWSGIGGGWGNWPMWPAGYAGSWWLGAVCGTCVGSCGCNSASEIRLEVPAQSIAQILIDGVELPSESYAFYNGTTLVRTDGEQWPLCQDWTVPVSGVGAWSITPRYGLPVPTLGRLSVGQVACQIVKFCADASSCELPAGLKSQTRQGVTQVFLTPNELQESGSTGLAQVDRFLDAVNPGRLTLGARIWNPDSYARGSRRPGGAAW